MKKAEVAEERKFMKKMGFEPLETREGEFKMPKFMDCAWKRIPCGEKNCKICGRIIADRERHIAKGEHPDSPESIFEDMGNSFKEALAIIKKDAERLGINIVNIDGIKEPPKPEEFPLYRQLKRWHGQIARIGNDAENEEELWLDTEAAADLFWYANTLLAKVYRQLRNRWEMENGDAYGKFDFQYTKGILKEVLKTIKKSLRELALLRTGQKGELLIVLSQFEKLEPGILKI